MRSRKAWADPTRHEGEAFPWPLIGLAGLFQQTPRELYKMRYLWQAPVRLDNSKLVACLGAEPHTLLGNAVQTTLKALNVI